MKQAARVVVAMSGGVDSSMAAALLAAQGYQVIGMMLRLWSEPGREESNRCCTPDAMAQARKVAQQLDIPFYAIDVRERFREQVVEGFIEGYRNGVTPNPCVICNRSIRWGALYQQARAMDADFMATGHYARIDQAADGTHRLLKGLDEHKDQSYVLSVLTQEQLAHSLFPVGELPKPQVRALAREYGLPVAERPDSQDLCFLAGEDYRGFLSRMAPEVTRPGKIRSVEGETLGEHQGLAFYTIGQRKGLGISAPEPYYVIRKAQAANELIVGASRHLGADEMRVEQVNWMAGAPPADEFTATVKIRYKASEVPASVFVMPEGRVRVKFNRPLRDITPGQRAVFYDGAMCLGGGAISNDEEAR